MRIRQEQTFDPTSVYEKEFIEGFTVLINPEVLKHRYEAAEVRKELRSQIKAIARVVPTRALAALEKVQTWVEWKEEGVPVFHPSAMWLKENGYNPEKAGGIELSNANNFIRWSRVEQPWLLLHELSHAYHHLVLGANHEGIKAAYKQAVDRKLYEAVPHIRGGNRTAYALTNAKEYYAELSEAYFGRNDFYPFTHTELKEYDPVGYLLMERTWGKPRTLEAVG